MRSKKFKEKDTDEALENKKELLKSQMNFSHKNFDTLIKEGALFYLLFLILNFLLNFFVDHFLMLKVERFLLIE